MQKGKRILIAPDKFKGSLSGAEICSILNTVIQKVIPDAVIETCPLADGGDGSIEILSSYLEIKERFCDTVDPLGRPSKASYFMSEDTAYIELASASGIVLLEQSDRNPMHTSTYGTGLLIRDAIELGLKNIYLFLGGSSTNDGGMGIADSMGYTFYDKNGNLLAPNGISLAAINRIVVPPKVSNIEKFIICCDVNNPPFGPNGAAKVYGKQKGANQQEIIHLDVGIKNLCHQIELFNGVSLSTLEGGGAAGGTAICLSGFFNAEIISGMDFIAEATMLDAKIEAADIVISGEGRLDTQSFNGKVISGVAEICQKLGKKLWLVVGKNELSKQEVHQLGAEGVFSIFEKADNLDDAMANSEKYLKEIGHEIAELFQVDDTD
jgi:glycerate kinase